MLVTQSYKLNNDDKYIPKKGSKKKNEWYELFITLLLSMFIALSAHYPMNEYIHESILLLLLWTLLHEELHRDVKRTEQKKIYSQIP